MKKWVIFLVIFSSLFFTMLNKVLGGAEYHYAITVSFALIVLVCYSIVSVLAYRVGIAMKDIKYIYFFSMSSLMSLILFFIIVKNITLTGFDKLYFTQLKFAQIVLFAFALFLVSSDKRLKALNFTILFFFSLNLYLAFSFFRMELMTYLPLILYVEIILCFELFSERNIKRAFEEILVYNIFSELFFVYYLKTYNFSIYITALAFFLLGVFRISTYFSYLLNRDYYRKQYVKEKKSNKLLDVNNKPIIILKDFTVKKANKAALNLFGYKTIGEIRGQNIFNLFNIKDFDEENFEEGLKDGERKISINLVDGSTHRMIIDIYKVKGINSGEYIIEFKEEVSFDEIFYKLNDELENVVYIYDEDEGYKFVSKGVTKLLHYSPKDFYEDKWFTKKISVDNKFEKILKNKEEQSSFMARYRTKEGEIVYLKENIKRIDMGEKSIFYGIVTEVTEFVHEIEELNALKRDLEEKNDKKDMSMSIVSHEIRTPITAIIGFLENIIINNRSIEKTIDNMIKKAYSNSIRLKELVNNLLDLNKLNAGKLEIYLETNDLKALVDEVLLNNETLLEIKNIKCTNELNVKIDILSDSAMLYQIVNNIVSNSIKYNKDSGTLNVSVTDDENFVILKIRDTGIGIPEDNKEKIFLEYERVRGSKEKGTGLGLPLAKRLIELNEGSIWFESQPDKGTSFYLKFKKV